jgi:thiamine transport system permease protein
VAKEMAGDLFLMTIGLIVLNFGSILFLLVKLSALPSFDFQSIQAPFYGSVIFTFHQAILSTLVSVILGFLAAPGYSRLNTFQRPVRWILLFPSLMSPVLSILALLTSFKNFPFGLSGIVLGHAFLNAGLCTVWLGDAWKTIEEKWAPVNFVLGGNPWNFFKKVIWPQLKPVTLNTSAVIFSFCLSSFAIPFVLGGSPQYSTLEVFIYERLRAAGDLSSAVFVGLVQSLMQFLIFLLILKNIRGRETKSPQILIRLKPLSWLTVPTGIVTALTLLPILRVLEMGIPQWPHLHDLILSRQFKESAFNSVFVSLVVGILTFFTLPFIASFGVRRYFLKFPALSGVVVGLGCLVIMNFLDINNHTKFILLLIYGHLCVIFIPILRLSWPRISDIRGHYEQVITQLGAPSFLALKKVYLPLEMKFFISAGALAAIWSMGEFSVSRILTGEYSTLPIFISNLISSYRLELASGVATLLLFMTVISLTFFEALCGMD